MELRQYWQILWKRIWIPAVLVVLVGGFSLLTAKPALPSYSASLRFVVGVEPEQLPDQFTYDGYYADVSSEFIADDLSVVVSSQAFAEDVNRHLAEMGTELQIPPGTLAGMTFADKQHRILRVTVTWGNPDQLLQIGQAVVQTIQNDSPKYLAQMGALGGKVVVIDRPLAVSQNPVPLSRKLDLPLRLILAVVAGIALEFLLHYLDTSVQSAAELESLGMPVLAKIPRQK